LVYAGVIKMASSFTWLDYSEDDRQKMLDILNISFMEHEARDELGIGVVRDAFSDMLFPGTSTIQTRARYFLFVPWIYQSLETKKVPSSRIEVRARDEEVKLIYALIKSDDTDGVIGKEAKKNLQRLPSSIYWHGLQSWGIRLDTSSISDYHSSLDAFYKFSKNGSHSLEETIDGFELKHNWDPDLPPAPDDFPDKASFHLTYDEASYLKENVLHMWPKTMLAYLLDSKLPLTSVQFPWQHPICPGLPQSIKDELFHARAFSESIYGAALLYNLMLAEKAKEAKCQGYDELAAQYKEKLEIWADLLSSRQDELNGWDYKEKFWRIVSRQGARPTWRTQQFIQMWLQIALSPRRARRVSEDDFARDLIQKREKQLKRRIARLDNPEALARWCSDPSTKMAGQLRYRWRPAEKIINDILRALRGQ
jgi:hypothetical protein